MNSDPQPQLVLQGTGDGLAVAAVAGALDIHTAQDLHEQATAVPATHPHLVLDMSQVTFCDSSGLNTLLRLRRHAAAAGGSLALAAVPGQAMRMLSVTDTDAVFTLHSRPAQALADHATRRRPSS
ncbi:STAS domain-containing protein [Streptomyces katrae]|uniref:STAS domain-containing protein n=1 Tax=Streptomyces katrae TaxID=68223 RepID=UPI001F2C96F7|nr:STAS domain-containing protein [Streptomyces katrae]